MEIMDEPRRKVDNFELLNSLLDYTKPNSFYEVQILRRSKENPEMKTGEYTINIYYLYNINDLLRYKERIIEDCIDNNARAYINLNRLDSEMIGFETQKLIIDLMMQRQYHAIRRAYAKTCGNTKTRKNVWLFDIDLIDKNGIYVPEQLELANSITEAIKIIHKTEKKKNYRILGNIPTKNGYHIVTNPFNKEKFLQILPNVVFYENSPTLLYI